MFEKEAEELIEESKKLNTTPRETVCKAIEFGYNKCKEEINQKGLALQSDMDETIEQNIALKKMIEQMKCCANCMFSESDRLNGTFCHKEGCYVLASGKCKLWESE